MNEIKGGAESTASPAFSMQTEKEKPRHCLAPILQTQSLASCLISFNPQLCSKSCFFCPNSAYLLSLVGWSAAMRPLIKRPSNHRAARIASQNSPAVMLLFPLLHVAQQESTLAPACCGGPFGSTRSRPPAWPLPSSFPHRQQGFDVISWKSSNSTSKFNSRAFLIDRSASLHISDFVVGSCFWLSSPQSAHASLARGAQQGYWKSSGYAPAHRSLAGAILKSR